MVQWLRLYPPSAGAPGSIPGQGTRSHMPQLKEPTFHMLQQRSKIPYATTNTQYSQINNFFKKLSAIFKKD